MSWRNQDVMGEPWHEKFCKGCDSEIGTICNPSAGDGTIGECCFDETNPVEIDPDELSVSQVIEKIALLRQRNKNPQQSEE